MPLINQIKDMQNQGMQDEQIVQELQAQGYSPLEISQSIEQAKIKSAVYPLNIEEPVPISGEMQPSLMQEQRQETPLIQETPNQEEYYPTPQTQPQYQEYPQPQAQEYQQQYPQEYQPYLSLSPETMTDIAEQISDEKIGKLKKQILELSTFKTISERKIENIDERLKKIENMIDKLQQAIIGKISGYGENIEDIKKEMEMMQESFSKAISPIVDKKQKEQENKEKEKPKERKKSAIEHYLRR